MRISPRRRRTPTLPRLPLLLAAVVALAAVAGAAAGGLSGRVAAGDDPPPLGVTLEGAPWLVQPSGSPRIADQRSRPALRFPPGVGYPEALRRLFVAALETGEVPADARLVGDLPRGVVLRHEDDGGVTVSLVAPWGYAPDTGAVLAPSYSLPASLSPEETSRIVEAARDEGTALPEGARVDVPDLPACQVASWDREPPPCAALGTGSAR